MNGVRQVFARCNMRQPISISVQAKCEENVIQQRKTVFLHKDASKRAWLMLTFVDNLAFATSMRKAIWPPFGVTERLSSNVTSVTVKSAHCLTI